MNTVTVRIPKHHKFHAEITPLQGVDAGLVEARCVEIPTLSEYAGTEAEAIALLKDAIVTTAKYRNV